MTLRTGGMRIKPIWAFSNLSLGRVLSKKPKQSKPRTLYAKTAIAISAAINVSASQQLLALHLMVHLPAPDSFVMSTSITINQYKVAYLDHPPTLDPTCWVRKCISSILRRRRIIKRSRAVPLCHSNHLSRLPRLMIASTSLMRVSEQDLSSLWRSYLTNVVEPIFMKTVCVEILGVRCSVLIRVCWLN